MEPQSFKGQVRTLLPKFQSTVRKGLCETSKRTRLIMSVATGIVEIDLTKYFVTRPSNVERPSSE